MQILTGICILYCSRLRIYSLNYCSILWGSIYAGSELADDRKIVA